MKTLARLVALPLLLALALAAPAVAQTPVPPQTTPVSWSTQVIGTLVNRTEGGALPDRLDLVLHAWDADLNERLMLDEQSGPDGTFRFEDVPVEPGLLYSVMATYEGVSYFSEPVRAIEGENLPPFEVPIYETTTDTSQIQIERMHVMFLASHAGLEVAEVYSLSNLGDRAVKEAVSLADGTPATFEFPLPTDAANVTFYPDGSNRFVRTPGGFADTGSLLPGAGSGQIMVNYVLPYMPGKTYEYAAQFATRGMNFLVAEDSGLTVTGDGFTPASAQQTSDGLKFAVLTRGPLQPGESVRVTLSGELTPTVATQ
ncbi:MAG TPA: hypothetical protein VJ754_01915, partial [Anaerolineae bacterium]|nr:hypothetical protein [Anaerolineae bacterium]